MALREHRLPSYCSLPADPSFAANPPGNVQCILSQVSLKDVVMARACSNNRDDLNRDPSVRRSYRRNTVTGRLESTDTQIPQVSNKRPAQVDLLRDGSTLKKNRTRQCGILPSPVATPTSYEGLSSPVPPFVSSSDDAMSLNQSQFNPCLFHGVCSVNTDVKC